MQLSLQTSGQISILLLASPHQQFPLSVSEGRVAMEIEGQGNRTSCRETVAQVHLWANGKPGAPRMATAPSPEGRGPGTLRRGQLREGAQSVELDSGRGWFYVFLTPAIGLGWSLPVPLPRTLAIQEAAWKPRGGEGGRAIL